MADKDLGKRTFESLTKASLSVRYTRLINGQNGSRASPVSSISPSADASSANSGSAAPKLRTVIEPYPPVRMKGLLGLHQDSIRTLQSPIWLIDEKRQLQRKNGSYPAGARLVAAANSLLDLCRFLEIQLTIISRDTLTLANSKTPGTVIDSLGTNWERSLPPYGANFILRSNISRPIADVRMLWFVMLR
jgi:hypothetical protein